MRFFIDTEFIESGPGKPIHLLSIGIVAEDGRELYLENSDAPLNEANDWVKANVLPQMNGPRFPRVVIRSEVHRFIGDGDPKPEFWGYYADYDWVVFCQLFGSMVNLPNGWPMYCRDLKQWCDDLGNPKLPPQDSTEHNALNDARWNRRVHEYLAELTLASSRAAI